VKGDRLPIFEHLLFIPMYLFALSVSGGGLAINLYQQDSSGLKFFFEGIPGSSSNQVDCQRTCIQYLSKKNAKGHYSSLGIINYMKLHYFLIIKYFATGLNYILRQDKT